MNLREMHQRVADITRHNPKVPASRREVYRELDDSHRWLCTAHEWTFMYRTAPLWMVPDLVGPATLGAHPTTAITIGTATADGWGERATTALHDDLRLLTEAMLDGEVELETPDATFTEYQPWSEAPFNIDLATVVVSSGDAAWVLYLDPRFVPDDTAATTTVTNAAIRFRRRGLPPDCLHPLFVAGPRGTYPVVGPHEAREHMTTGARTHGLDIADQTAPEPRIFVHDTGGTQRVDWPPSRRLASSLGSTDENSYATRQRQDYRGIHPPPVHQTWSLASNNGGSGGLSPNTTYRVMLSWYVGGRFGPASDIQEVTLGGSDDGIALSSLPIYESGHHANGRRLSVWMAKGAEATSESAFYLVGFALDEQDADFTVEFFPPDTDSIPANTGAFEYAKWLLRWDEEYSPRYTYLRPWPRPTAFERFEVTYLARPRQLLDPRDEPDAAWHVFHDAIVHHTCMKLAGIYGARTMQRQQERMLNRRIAMMKARFLPADPMAPKGILPGISTHRFPNGVDYQG